MLQPSTVMRALEASGVEEYVLLQGVDGDLVVMVEAEGEAEEHDRLFFSATEAEGEQFDVALRPY